MSYVFAQRPNWLPTTRTSLGYFNWTAQLSIDFDAVRRPAPVHVSLHCAKLGTYLSQDHVYTLNLTAAPMDCYCFPRYDYNDFREPPRGLVQYECASAPCIEDKPRISFVNIVSGLWSVAPQLTNEDGSQTGRLSLFPSLVELNPYIVTRQNCTYEPQWPTGYPLISCPNRIEVGYFILPRKLGRQLIMDPLLFDESLAQAYPDRSRLFTFAQSPYLIKLSTAFTEIVPG